MPHLPSDPRGRLSAARALATIVTMSDPVTALLDKFVAELRKVIRAEIVQSLVAGESLAPTPTPKSAPKAPGKRTSEVLASQAAAILVYVKRHPQCTAQAIADGIGVELKELKLPFAKLKAERSIKTTGVRRGTKYTAR
jgi:hypothetical protein